MRRLRAKNKWTRTELAIGGAVVAVTLLLVGLILLRSQGAHSLDSQRCPIDGDAGGVAERWALGRIFVITGTSAWWSGKRIPGGRLAGEAGGSIGALKRALRLKLPCAAHLSFSPFTAYYLTI